MAWELKLRRQKEMSNLDNELTMKNCSCCGKKIVIMKEFIRPKIYCTIRCMDVDNMKGNIPEEKKKGL